MLRGRAKRTDLKFQSSLEISDDRSYLSKIRQSLTPQNLICAPTLREKYRPKSKGKKKFAPV